MFKKKTLALLVSLILVLCATVGGTIAFLIDTTDPVKNIFTPSKVTTSVEEDLEGNMKKNVKIKNTGDTTACIRAYYIVTWQNEQGQVYGTAPVEDTDFEVELNLNQQTDPAGKWLEGSDGFYYWSAPVEKTKTTGALINFISPVAGRTPDGYTLHVEIIGSGIQSAPKAAFEAWAPDSGITWGKTALTK